MNLAFPKPYRWVRALLMGICLWGSSARADESTEEPGWHSTRSGRFATWVISGGGAQSIGYASRNERFEIGGEAWGIFSLFAFGGVGPYVRLRPVPGEFGQKLFLHTAVYGGYQFGPGEEDSQWRALPNAFVGYDKGEKFYGLGIEGLFILGQRW